MLNSVEHERKFYSLGARGNSLRRKTCNAPNTATLYSCKLSYCRIPLNRANGVAVFEEIHIWYNTAYICPVLFAAVDINLLHLSKPLDKNSSSATKYENNVYL